MRQSDNAVELLQALVRTPSFSRQESATASILANWLNDKVMDGSTEAVHRSGNNIWVRNFHFDPTKPTILLCSHHDTVPPTPAWTRDPFDGAIEDEPTNHCGARLFGLGSNDAGASVVSLAAAFRHFYECKDLKYNLILALVAEEEISGAGGIRSILPELGLTNSARADENATNHPADFAIVGEPTGMQLAVAEKGLLVLDCTAHGRAGHAARDEGDNAIYHALNDIDWFRNFRFPRKSDFFGDVKMSITMISAGTAHNVIPSECKFVVDVRVTEQYTNEEVLQIIRENVRSDVQPRSMHLRSSSIDHNHPIVLAGKALGLTTFGSPTTSDQVALSIPSVKIGPGQSARSHSADEYVELAEVEQGIDLYIKLLDKIL